MKLPRFILVFTCVVVSTLRADEFPRELTLFAPADINPVFTARGPGHWDAKIRERGWIIRDDSGYHLWYTGYAGRRGDLKLLGYAFSRDGIRWERHPDNPIHREHWIEDMMVLKNGETYYMFAEGTDDVAHLLTSTDRIHWKRIGPLDIRLTNGEKVPPGPYGTPTVWIENGTWYLFYERGDMGIWLAASKDHQVWTNVQDDPVIPRGPKKHDKDQVALNQIIKYDGRYYAYYHGSGDPDEDHWCTCLATSADLVHWKKFPGNPILADNKSSGILIHDGEKFRLYTMHDKVEVHFSK